ncbi:MAG: metallophosphoesterase [Victivallales bacterium]
MKRLMIKLCVLSFLLFPAAGLPAQEMVETVIDSKIYSRPDPETPPFSGGNIKRVVIVATNDLHGKLQPRREEIKIGNRKISYPIGGIEMLGGYFKILKKHYGKELLLVDAGDIYNSGGFPQRKLVVEIYNYLGYHALTFGNHEFDPPPELRRVKGGDGYAMIKKIAAASKAPFVAGNMTRRLEDGSEVPLDWPNVKVFHIQEINGIKIGIIGIAKQSSFIPNNSHGICFNLKPVSDSIIESAKLARANGARIVVLLFHEGTLCDINFDGNHINTPEDKNRKDFKLCKRCEFTEILEKIANAPGNPVDVVVSGHSHSKICHFCGNMPVIQSLMGGKFFGQAELFYDTRRNILLKDKTLIHLPTKVCHKFFDATDDCYNPAYDERDSCSGTKRVRPLPGNVKLVPAKFLGETVAPDGEITKILQQHSKSQTDASAGNSGLR